MSKYDIYFAAGVCHPLSKGVIAAVRNVPVHVLPQSFGFSISLFVRP